ncbi:MAG: ATP-binding protein [Myxococcota bacterium]
MDRVSTSDDERPGMRRGRGFATPLVPPQLSEERWSSQLLHRLGFRPSTRLAPSMLFFRNVGAVAIAAVACLLPEVGPNRFWLAGILVFVSIPCAIWLERHFPVSETGWSEPLFDLVMVVSLVHLVPSMWFPALVIGLMVVQAPSVGSHQRSFLFYALFAAILTSGMTFAAWLHDVEDWKLPILCMAVLYPSVIFYSYQQARRTRALRAHTEALESLYRVAGGVAHDFNNVLTSVMGHAELAMADLPGTHPARTSLTEVVRGANRASLLSGRLLAFSGRGQEADAFVDVEGEVRDLVELLRPIVSSEIALEVHSKLQGETVRCPRSQFQQALMNLVINACEATAVSKAPVRIHLESPQGEISGRRWVRIRVVDQGVGIPAQHQDRIFDPFFTSKGRGHGLGLASARQTIEEVDGRIFVESREGSGTQVTVYLPAQTRVPSVRASLAGVSQGARVALVVDDEDEVRRTMASLLEHLRFEVIEAESGTRALEIVEEYGRDIELAVLDVRMPGMSGWDLLASLRGRGWDRPVVVCSGYDVAGSGRSATDPRLRFIAKPFRLGELRDTLEGLGLVLEAPGAAARGAQPPPEGRS